MYSYDCVSNIRVLDSTTLMCLLPVQAQLQLRAIFRAQDAPLMTSAYMQSQTGYSATPSWNQDLGFIIRRNIYTAIISCPDSSLPIVSTSLGSANVSFDVDSRVTLPDLTSLSFFYRFNGSAASYRNCTGVPLGWRTSFACFVSPILPLDYLITSLVISGGPSSTAAVAKTGRLFPYLQGCPQNRCDSTFFSLAVRLENQVCYCCCAGTTSVYAFPRHSCNRFHNLTSIFTPSRLISFDGARTTSFNCSSYSSYEYYDYSDRSWYSTLSCSVPTTVGVEWTFSSVYASQQYSYLRMPEALIGILWRDPTIIISDSLSRAQLANLMTNGGTVYVLSGLFVHIIR
jgi:hypothetical protein